MRKIFILVLALTVTAISGNAQQNVTLYNMSAVPQKMYANPSFIPDAKVFVGVPGLSSHHYNMAFTRLKLNDFLGAIEHPTPDSSVLNLRKLGDIFADNNYIGLQYNFDIIHFGLRLNTGYLTANVSVHNNFQMNIPGDLFDFLFEGNGGANLGRTFNFDMGLDFLQYTEFGVGYATTFLDDRLSLGARGKYIKGLAALETERNDISFYTDPNDFTLRVKSDLRFNMANSYSNIENPDADQQWGLPGSFSGLFNSNNTGLGLDIGAKFELTDRIDLTGSINNLGWINWNTYTKNYYSKYPNQYIEYDGVDYKEIFDTSGSFREALREVGDSIKDQLALDSSNQNFQTNLRPEFYIGGTLDVGENHKAGVLLYGSFYQKRLYPAFTLSWNSNFGNILGLSVSYSMMHRTYMNIGLGVSVNAGPVQFYFVSDNLFGAFDVRSSSVVNFRTGLNLTFGRKNKEEPEGGS